MGVSGASTDPAAPKSEFSMCAPFQLLAPSPSLAPPPLTGKWFEHERRQSGDEIRRLEYHMIWYRRDIAFSVDSQPVTH